MEVAILYYRTSEERTDHVACEKNLMGRLFFVSAAPEPAVLATHQTGRIGEEKNTQRPTGQNPDRALRSFVLASANT